VAGRRKVVGMSKKNGRPINKRSKIGKVSPPIYYQFYKVLFFSLVVATTVVIPMLCNADCGITKREITDSLREYLTEKTINKWGVDIVYSLECVPDDYLQKIFYDQMQILSSASGAKLRKNLDDEFPNCIYLVTQNIEKVSKYDAVRKIHGGDVSEEEYKCIIKPLIDGSRMGLKTIYRGDDGHIKFYS
jgi:hypothetical protein